MKRKIVQPDYCIAEFQVSYKSKPTAERKFTQPLQNSFDCAKVLREIWEEGTIEWKESFIIILLNRANKVVAFHRISSGGITGTVADPRVIMQIALLANASYIVMSHNHPSGNLRPSKSDQDFTRQLVAAGKLLEIRVLDHIILTEDGHFSFGDEGLLD